MALARTKRPWTERNDILHRILGSYFREYVGDPPGSGAGAPPIGIGAAIGIGAPPIGTGTPIGAGAFVGDSLGIGAYGIGAAVRGEIEVIDLYRIVFGNILMLDWVARRPPDGGSGALGDGEGLKDGESDSGDTRAREDNARLMAGAADTRLVHSNLWCSSF